MYTLRRLQNNVEASSTHHPAIESNDFFREHATATKKVSFWSSKEDSNSRDNNLLINIHDEIILERSLQQTEKWAYSTGFYNSWSLFRGTGKKQHLSTNDGLTKNVPLSPPVVFSIQKERQGLSLVECMSSQQASVIYNGTHQLPSSHEPNKPSIDESKLGLIKTDSADQEATMKTTKKYHIDTKMEVSRDDEEIGDDDDVTAAETPSPVIQNGLQYLNRFRHGQWV
jgi:hypothetical protein